MTFSFNLVLALFLLAPGLALVAGVYAGSQQAHFNSAPPPAGSILTLTLVTAGALVAHAAAALLYGLQRFACERIDHCLVPPVDPNPYRWLASMLSGDASDAGLGLGWFLVNLIALTAIVYLLSRNHIRKDLTQKQSRYRAALFGWLSDFIEKTENGKLPLIAYVLTDIEHEGRVVGYEGAVSNITLNASKEITSILLVECENFYLRLGAETSSRQPIRKATPIEHLYLQQEDIRNVAFEVLDIKMDAAAAV